MFIGLNFNQDYPLVALDDSAKLRVAWLPTYCQECQKIVWFWFFYDNNDDHYCVKCRNS